MKRAIEKKVEEWIDSIREQITPTHEADSHIDDLLKECLPEKLEEKIEAALICYQAAVSFLGDDRQRLKVWLVWPYDDSELLDLNSPTSLEWGFEPPSLFISDRKTDMFLYETEEYKTPILVKNSIPSPHNAQVYYRCFRKLKDIEVGEYYQRCIYIEDYPPELRF